MKKLRLYLDNCCFNRPYDDQEYVSIKMETECKLLIQKRIEDREIELCWSYILDFENESNPFLERKIEIGKWKTVAAIDINEGPEVLSYMHNLQKKGLKPLDALHISCAKWMEADYFLTVDKGILRKVGAVGYLKIISPIDFVIAMEEKNDRHRA